MEYKFFSFKIENDKSIINVEPYEFFNVDFSVRYVVLYKLTLIDKRDKLRNRESIIPYYISNGHTNKLRANMIYPFMCYSNWKNQGVCPFYANEQEKIMYRNRNFLLKYQFGPNYKYLLLEKQVIDSFIDMKGPENEDTQRKALSKLDRLSIDNSRDLPSVLPRLRNLSDLVMCIMNENIIHFHEDKINIRCFRPMREEEDPEYINMSKCNLDPERLNSHDDYRFVLLTVLSRYANLIIKNNILENIQSIPMIAKPITLDAFNIRVAACDRESIIINTTSYGIISTYFKDIFRSKLDRLSISIDRSNMTTEESDIINFVHMMPDYFKVIDSFEVYKDHLRQYKMDCSRPIESEESEMLSRPDL
jgi:hypothetical protein